MKPTTALAVAATALSAAALGVSFAGAAGQRAAAGAVPTTVAYQGYLSTSAGAAVADGDRTLTFRLYTAPTGGRVVWQETQTVTTQRGVFSTLLGSSTAFGNAFDTAPLYLGVQPAGEDELQPRQQLAATPFAVRASDADALGGAPPTSYVRGGGAGLEVREGRLRRLGIREQFRLPQGCRDGRIPEWSRTAARWECGQDDTGGGAGDLSGYQRRVTERCGANRAIRAVDAQGDVTCTGRFAAFEHDHALPGVAVRRVVTRIENTDPFNAHRHFPEATCPRGEMLVGGGFSQLHGEIERSHPSENGRRWQVTALVSGLGWVEAYALCLRLSQP